MSFCCPFPILSSFSLIFFHLAGSVFCVFWSHSPFGISRLKKRNRNIQSARYAIRVISSRGVPRPRSPYVLLARRSIEMTGLRVLVSLFPLFWCLETDRGFSSVTIEGSSVGLGDLSAAPSMRKCRSRRASVPSIPQRGIEVQLEHPPLPVEASPILRTAV